MRDDMIKVGALLGMASGDVEETMGFFERATLAESRSQDSPDERIISVPAAFDKTKLEALGFIVLDEQSEDDGERHQTFVRVQYPEGWSITRSPQKIRFLDQRGVCMVDTNDNGKFYDRYAYTCVLRQGYEIPCQLCYGEDTTLDSVLWDKLSEDEQKDVIEGLKKYVSEGEQCPQVWGDTAAKAQQWLDEIARRQ